MRAKIYFDFFILFSLLALGMILGACFMFEFSWDFANYHYYNPWAFFNGRLGYDIAPASVNTYFNPLIDIPFYSLVKYFNDSPQFVSAVQGSYYGILLFVFYKICLLFFAGSKGQKVLKTLLALLIGGTGYATFMQISTTTNEIQIAILVLSGFYFLAKEFSPCKSGKNTAFILSGLLFGTALGLKLTAVIYCAASGISLILMFRHIERPLVKIGIFTISGLLAFLAVNGYWMWQMWLHFGNPLFPFANAIFKSEYYDLANFSDRRYLPKNWVQFVFYPFFWASHDKRYVGERVFIDPRFAVLSLIAFAWLLMFVKRKTQTSLFNKFLYLFMFTSYAIWLSLFSIIRYLIPIEMLAAIVIVQVLWYVKTEKIWQQILIYPFIVVFIFILTTVFRESESWGTRAGSEKIIDVENVEVKDNSLIFLYNMPSAAIGAWFADKAENVRLLGTLQFNAVEMKGTDFSDRKMFRKIKDDLISQHNGDIIALVRLWCSKQCLDKIAEDKMLQDMYCRELKNNLDSNVFVCRYQKWFEGNQKGLEKLIQDRNNMISWSIR